MNELLIKVNDLKLFGYHGWYDEEAVLGTEYIFNIELKIDVIQEIHQLSETIDYVKVSEIVAEQMKIRSKLLEELGERIKGSLLKSFPMLKELRISIKKLNPSLKYSVSSSEIVIHYYSK